MIHKAGQKLVYPKEYAVVQQASSAAWWNGAYAAYDAKNAANLAASYLDLTGNGHNLPGTGGNQNLSLGNGWVGPMYLFTGISGLTKDWSVLIKFKAYNLSVPSVPFGVFSDSGTSRNFYIQNISGGINYANGGGASYSTTLQAAAVYGIAGLFAYLNGAQVASIPDGIHPTSLEVTIGGLNRPNLSSVAQLVAATISSIRFDNSVLSLAQVATIGADMP